MLRPARQPVRNHANIGAMARHCALLITSWLVVGAAAVGATPAFEFPAFHSKDPQQPVQIVAQKIVGPEAEGGRQTLGKYGPLDPAIGGWRIDPQRPFGAVSLPLGLVTARGSAPMRIVFDYAGYSNDALGGDSRRQLARFVGAAVCEPAALACLVRDDTGIWDSDAEMSGVKRLTVRVDGIERHLLVGRAELTLENPAALSRNVFIAVHSTAHMELVQLRATALFGEYSSEDPGNTKTFRAWIRAQRVGRFTPFGVLAAVLLVAGLALHAKRRAPPNPAAPRLLGVLLVVLGLSASIGTLVANDPASPSSLYFVIIGLLWSFAGVHLFFGRVAARTWYGWSLALVWFWSLAEFELSESQLYLQLIMPTLLGLYLFSNRVTDRLD